MKNYFSTDWHLAHKNILRFDNRPFRSIEEHDEKIIKNTMKLLKPGDNFYYLGDFVFKNKRYTESILQTLVSSGANLYFIKGNHDKDDTVALYIKYGIYLGEQKKIRVGEQEIILNHFKMLIWDKSHHGSWHLYGHSHGDAEHYVVGKSMDVAINIHNYHPIEFVEIKKILDARILHTIDHHNLETERYRKHEQQNNSI